MNLNRTSITFKISVSLAGLVISILLAAQTLGFLPDGKHERIRAQLAMCETIAVQTSLAIQYDQMSLMQDSLRAIVDRNSTIAYARVFHHKDKLVDLTSGNQPIPPSELNALTVVNVPIVSNKQPWGIVELGLCSPETNSSSFLMNPFTRLLLFCGCLAILAFFIYLRRLLQHLDPSNVVPDRVRTTLDTLAEGLVVVDSEQRIVLANNALASMLNSTSEDLLGQNITNYAWLFEDDELFEDELPWTMSMNKKTVVAGQVLQLVNEAGQRRTLRVNASPIDGARNGCEGALVSFDDVTLLEERNTALTSMLDRLRDSRDQIQRQNRELTVLATQDPLTGALNRRCFFEEFERHWSQTRQTSAHISCTMIDVDHFKSINDNYGHAAGDAVLKEVVAAVQTAMRPEDILCRYGGEEFCVLSPDVNIVTTMQLSDAIRAAIAKIKIEGIDSITASTGASSSVFGADSPNDLLNQADAALYHSKRTGRNRSTCWGDIKDNTDVLQRTEGNGKESISVKTVNALLDALGSRDSATVDHCRRVADLCFAVSETLLSETERDLLQNAALLHDIGKICVPDSLLHKKTSLDSDDKGVLGTHLKTGVEIVRATVGCNELADLIMHHHNGQKNVPIASRILTIADAYDEMTGDFGDRQGVSKQDAVAELLRLAGKKYDPVLVKQFVAYLAGESTGAEPDIKKQLDFSPSMAVDTQNTLVLEPIDHLPSLV